MTTTDPAPGTRRSHPCPTCGAKPGEHCVVIRGTNKGLEAMKAHDKRGRS